MSDEIKEAPASKPKVKTEKVTLKLMRAGSCNYDGLLLKKGETVELESARAEQFMKSGLFEKV